MSLSVTPNMNTPRTTRKRGAARAAAQPPAPRAYRQQLRAQQADANTDRILAAGVTLIKTSRRLGEITLDDIARESGVTVRTVLRRFGSRDGVLEAAFLPLKDEIKSLRRETLPGDVDDALAMLLDQYEQMGDFNIRALEAEDQLALVHRGLEMGRQSHREWLSATFAPQLAARRPRDRERCLIALYAATDIYLWKLLRRDLKRTRDETRETFARLVRGVLDAND